MTSDPRDQMLLAAMAYVMFALLCAALFGVI